MAYYNRAVEDQEHRRRRVTLVKQGYTHTMVDGLFVQELAQEEALEQQQAQASEEVQVTETQNETIIELLNKLTEKPTLINVNQIITKVEETWQQLDEKETKLYEFRKSIGAKFRKFEEECEIDRDKLAEFDNELKKQLGQFARLLELLQNYAQYLEKMQKTEAS